MAAGGAGALAGTVVSHFVYVVVGDAIAALIGFVAAYALCAGRSRRSATDDVDSRPSWVSAGRRVAAIAAALVLVLGDSAVYRMGMHGLGRKVVAVALATGVLAFGAWLTRWPRRSPL